MSYSELISRLHLEGKVLAATRVSEDAPKSEKLTPYCIFAALERALNGETLLLTPESGGCRGFTSNAGFSDEKPALPGGHSYFLSYGAGEGFPPGERIKCDPEVAAAHFTLMPKGVMTGYHAIRLEPYTERLCPDIVICFATPDQLSALAYLHAFRYPGYDGAILCTTAGCASLFRVPFDEMTKAKPRAVVGALDVTARPYIQEQVLSFTVSAKAFQDMLDDTGTCFFQAPIWKGLQKRLDAASQPA